MKNYLHDGKMGFILLFYNNHHIIHDIVFDTLFIFTIFLGMFIEIIIV